MAHYREGERGLVTNLARPRRRSVLDADSATASTSSRSVPVGVVAHSNQSGHIPIHARIDHFPCSALLRA
jgi:hypothetical protein